MSDLPTLRLINALCLTGKQQIPDRYSNTRQDLPTLEASMLTIIPPITDIIWLMNNTMKNRDKKWLILNRHIILTVAISSPILEITTLYRSVVNSHFFFFKFLISICSHKRPHVIYKLSSTFVFQVIE
jgi:hypothetical protein